MSYSGNLAKSRTVRFSAATERRLQAKAAQTGEAVSEVIRRIVAADLESGGKTAGEWVLSVASSKPASERSSATRSAFRRAYRKRHG